MRVSLKKSCLSLALGVLLALPAMAADTLLVAATGKNSKDAVAKAIGSAGKITGQTTDGFYTVELANGASGAKILAALKTDKSIRYAFPESAMSPGAASLANLDNHIAYLKATLALNGAKGENGEDPEVDYWEAHRERMAARTGPDGTIDTEAYYRAIEHREQMPPAPLPTDGSDGAFGTQALGGGWSYVGPTNLNVPYRTYYGVRPLSGRANGVAADPSNTNVIYVASAGGGVHKSTDGGSTWSALSDGWTYPQTSCVTLDPNNSSVVYVGTGDHHGGSPYGLGIMKSTNGGSTWTNLGSAEMKNNAVSEILVWPANSNVVIATTGGGLNGSGYVWRSTDAGATWTKAKSTANVDLPLANWCGGDFGEWNGTVRNWYVVGSGSSGGNIWRSDDAGATWTKLTNPVAGSHSVMAVAASKRVAGASTVYLLTPVTNTIWKSTNAGATWVNITGNHPTGSSNYNWSQDTYDYHITTGAATVNNVLTDIVYVGLITISVDINGDGTWTDIGITYTGSAKTHNDQHSFWTNPANGLLGFQGCDGGVFRTTVLTSPSVVGAFSPLNRYLKTTQFYAMTLHPTNTAWVMGGTQDNASPASRGDLANWSNPGAGDGSFCDIQDNNANIQYHSWQNAGVGRTVDGFATTNSDITPGSNYNGQPRGFIAPLTLGYGGNVGNLYVGTNRLWRYNGASNTWTADLGGVTLSPASVIRIVTTCPSNSARIYTGDSNGVVYHTANGGTNWNRIDVTPLPDRWVKDIEPSTSNSADIIVGLSALASGNLWRTTDASVASPVWTNISGAGATALPSVPVNSVARDPFDTRIFYAGTDVGVFVTYDSGANWYNATRPWGLPNVEVNDLKIFNSGGAVYLYCATFGRGIWRIPLVSTALTSLSVPTSGTGGFSYYGYAYFNAKSGATTVSLASSNTTAATVPATATSTAGNSYVRFLITTKVVGADVNVTFTATRSGVSKTDTMLVKTAQLSYLNIFNTSVIGGDTFGLGVYLTGKAYANTSVAMSDNSSLVWGYLTSVGIRAGASGASFSAKSSTATQDTLVTMTATRDQVVRTDTVTIKPGGLLEMIPSTTQVKSSGTVDLTIRLSAAAGVGGRTVLLSSSDSSALPVPASVFFPEGSASQTVRATAGTVLSNTTVRVTATLNNVVKNASITVTP